MKLIIETLNNCGEIDIIYFVRNNGIILQSKEHTLSPNLNNLRMKYLTEEENYYEFEKVFLTEIFGHCFVIFYDVFNKSIADKSLVNKNGIFKNYIRINNFTDIDFMLKILNK